MAEAEPLSVFEIPPLPANPAHFDTPILYMSDVIK
jgi:hypothetical protein